MIKAVFLLALTAATSSYSFSVPWLVVGGGVHGVHLAARLLGELGSDVCIVDDAPNLLFNWKTRTAATGMDYLRSSSGQHLGIKKNELRRFRQKSARFAKDYERPSLDYFNQHCDSIVSQFGLNQKHIQGRMISLERHEDFLRVDVKLSNDGSLRSIEAENVVLALGNDQPSMPDWVTSDLLNTGRVHHLLDTRHRGSCYKDFGSVAIVGGGLSAAQKALQLATHSNGKEIHLVSRHPLKEQQFDTHQDWMMDQEAVRRSISQGGSGLPERQRKFQRTSCLRERRQIITEERIPGTVTASVNRGRGGLQYAIASGQVLWHEAEIARVTAAEGHLVLEISSLGFSPTTTTIEAEHILLATGFGKKPPITGLDTFRHFPVSEFCGYPVVDASLRWGHDHVFVTGALAELELGASARNIAGARLAAERILQAAKTKHSPGVVR